MKNVAIIIFILLNAPASFATYTDCDARTGICKNQKVNYVSTEGTFIAILTDGYGLFRPLATDGWRSQKYVRADQVSRSK